MSERWVVVSLPTSSLVAVVTTPFRTREAAEATADSLNKTGEKSARGYNATAQVCRIESIAEVRRHIREGAE